MRGALCRLAVAALALASTGCATITYDAVLVERLVALNRIAQPGTYDQVGEVVVERRPIFVIADLLTVRDVELERVLQRELARTGGNAVINLRIEEKDSFIDVLISLVQAVPGVPPIVGTRTVTIRGDIIRLREGVAFSDGMQRLGEQCQPMEVSDGEPRTAYLCVPAP